MAHVLWNANPVYFIAQERIMNINVIDTPSVMTKSNLPISDYSANPYVGCTHGCKYCYASFMKRFTNHSEPWGEFLDVKNWPEIANPQRYRGKEVFLSSVTDPYLPEERQFGRTRALLEQLQGSEARLSIQTKSDLVLRDIDLIRSIPNARVGFSINTLDEDFKNDMDKAVSIQRRLDAMKALHDEHIRTTCFISPIFPGITDVQAIISRVKDQCNLIWLENLNLRGCFKPVILKYIHDSHPQLTELYDDIYLHGNRLYWESLNEEISLFAKQNGMEYVRDDDSMNKPFDVPPVIVNFFYHEQIKKNAKKAEFV
ncbi:MAG: radical SAM mobile pair protein B [Sphaerochaetaceae bacterium]|nr:radical SAM mobile pair protein B [Sphaerochaetaceae bacterium]